MAFTLFIGEIDVSVGSNLGLVAAVVGTMLRDGQPLIAAVVVGIAIGAAIGLINAWGVAVMKAPSLIFTLGGTESFAASYMCIPMAHGSKTCPKVSRISLR